MSKMKADWYSAPQHRHWLQWWNGQTWSESFWPDSLEPAEYLPDALRFDISAVGEPRFDIVGENWREAEIIAALGSRPERDAELVLEAIGELVPEPDNPHDAHAISVRVDGFNVGYLSSEQSGKYHPIVSRFIASGVVPTVRTRIWAVTRYVRSRGRDELKSAIRIALPLPTDIVPDNDPPQAPHCVIPRGRSIQVTGESEHFDLLSGYVRSTGTANLIVTLHPATITRAKSSATVLEVHLDGEPVGQLTPATSATLLPIVEEAQRQGRLPAAWAVLSVSKLGAEIVLKVAKAEGIRHGWPSETDALPTLMREPARLPSAYSAQVPLSAPPAPRGLLTWQIVAGALGLLVLLAIPYVGWVFAVAGAIGLGLLSRVLKQRAPEGSFAAPTVQKLPATV